MAAVGFGSKGHAAGGNTKKNFIDATVGQVYKYKRNKKGTSTSLFCGRPSVGERGCRWCNASFLAAGAESSRGCCCLVSQNVSLFFFLLFVIAILFGKRTLNAMWSGGWLA